MYNILKIFLFSSSLCLLHTSFSLNFFTFLHESIDTIPSNRWDTAFSYPLGFWGAGGTIENNCERLDEQLAVSLEHEVRGGGGSGEVKGVEGVNKEWIARTRGWWFWRGRIKREYRKWGRKARKVGKEVIGMGKGGEEERNERGGRGEMKKRRW